MKGFRKYLFSNLQINLRLFLQLGVLAVTGIASLFHWQSLGLMQSINNLSPQHCIVRFSSSTYSFNENSGTVTITVQRLLDIEPVSVKYTTSNGTANSGADYVTSSGTLFFEKKEMQQTFTIQITDDTAAEGNETINLTLSEPAGGASLGTPSNAVLTVVDNEQSTSTNRKGYDFDGDNKADVSVFRPDSGVWYLLNSTSGFSATQFGISTDKIVPADFDGDGKTDIAVYRDGIWYLLRSSSGFIGVGFGTAEDIPQPADFTGDGKAEVAVFRPSAGAWYSLNLQNNQFAATQFGISTDKPVVGDYDGDAKADVAVYRSGFWYVLKSTDGFTGVQFGVASDKPVPADFDGDSKTDFAVFRPENGTWYLLQSTAGFTGVQFGIATDKPTPADYDGDGKTDIAVFRDGNWYLLRSTQGFTGISFGISSDKPIPNAFVP